MQHQMIQTQTVNASFEIRSTLVELTKLKRKIRRIEEFCRKYETNSDVKGFMATRVLEILEDEDA